MKYNLSLDIGNSFCKAGIFHNNAIIELFRFDNEKLKEKLEDINNKYLINKLIFSSVSNIDDSFFDKLKDKVQIIKLNYKLPLPLKIKYKTLATLGNDRIALAVAGNNTFPNENVLVIDCGTCITYDFVNKNKEYLGGAISPGLKIRFKALNTFTANLPLVNYHKNINFTGQSTNDCISAGVYYGIINEIKGFINMYQSKYQDLKIIITGGDAKYFVTKLKNHIFADENLLLKGLNIILNYVT